MARFTTAGGSGSGAPGPQGPAGQAGSNGTNGADALWNYTGEYNGGASYAVGDLATYDGQLWYRANANGGNVGDTPSQGYIWNLLAAKGTDGTNGSSGLVYLGNYISGNGYVTDLAVVRGSDNNLYIAKANGGLADPVGNTAEWDIFSTNTGGGTTNTADFTFEASTMSTNEDMDINVLGVPGTITLSAYSGVNVQSSAEFGLTTNKIITTSNGATDNIKIGDDAYIGDGNIANNIAVIGQQDATQGGVVFGSNETEQISTDGSNLNIEADNDIILYPGSSYAYLGAPTVGGETRIATRGYVDALGTTTSTYTPNWTGTGLAYTGNPAVGSYIKIGNLVSFNIKVTLTNVTNFGTGQYSLTLPFAPISDYVFRDGGFHDTSNGNHHAIAADAEDGTVQMTLWHPGSSARDIAFDHNTPLTIATADYFYISGTYITAE